ncbi:Zn(2)-C6 fungal-type domain-containing protein [Fusarium sp. Ph1]|nr:Zn(2)-C6 fungal-type domain-containing protein [Fusarium sp. Ph1]
MPRTPSHPSLPPEPAPESANSTATPPSNLRRILQERSLAHSRKACLPCRERKVRCDHQQPCQTCRKRGHADLCLYPEPEAGLRSPKRRSHRHGEDGPVLDQVGSVETSQSTVNASTPSLLGGNSIIAVARRESIQPQSDSQRREAFETGIFPLLGMDTSSQQRDLSQVSHPGPSLPEDQEMIQLFNTYRHRVHPSQLVLDDIDEVERMICSLINRDSAQRQSDSHLLCLLHAILAAGAQFSDLAASTRLNKSQKHLKHALSHLGAFDYLWNPSKRLLQALIILGHVLQNDMNPRGAWVLGGTTIRLALSLGLHQHASAYDSFGLSSSEAQHLRLAIVWQDALLSLAFDRPPASHEMDLTSDLLPLGQEVALNYQQAMNWLCHLTLTHTRSRNQSCPLSSVGKLLDNFDALKDSVSLHLKDRQHCSSIRDIQEHYSLELHRNFTLSTLCRPVLSRQVRQSLGTDDSAMWLSRFQSALKKSVLAFIRLRCLSNLATRSWAFVHNGLSSALLLAFTRHLDDSEDFGEIQAQLVKSLSEGDEDAGRFSAAHRKALKALKVLQEARTGELAGTGQVGEAPSPNYEGDDVTFQEGMFDFQDSSMLGMDDWLRTFDFDAFSPLDAYNFIMSDQAPAGPSVGTLAET